MSYDLHMSKPERTLAGMDRVVKKLREEGRYEIDLTTDDVNKIHLFVTEMETDESMSITYYKNGTTFNCTVKGFDEDLLQIAAVVLGSSFYEMDSPLANVYDSCDDDELSLLFNEKICA